MSSPGAVTRGVPRWSYLGPLIFLIYVNNRTSLIADLTNLATSGIPAEVVQSRLNVDLEKVHWWLLGND